MLSGLSVLFFQTELLLPPIPELKIGKDSARNLFNRMFETGGYPYDNLEVVGDTTNLTTNRGEDTVSLCRLSPFSIRIEEKGPRLFSADEFVCTVNTVLRGYGSFGPVFSQRCKIQCVAQAHGSSSAVHLLAGKVANVWDKIDPFERPPGYFGVKFRFSPTVTEPDADEGNAVQPDGVIASPEEPIVHKGFITLRMETYGKDPKQVWMEAAVSHFFEESVSVPDDLGQIGENLRDTYSFLAVKSKNFLDQFDKSAPEDEEGGP